MTEAEALVGARYEAVAGSPLFQGRSPPERERIEDQSYVSELEIGLSLVLPDHDVIETVQLHSEGHSGFRQFAGALPAGLDFAMSQVQVRERLGEPERAGGETRVPILGVRPAWDRYLIDGRLVHIEYALDKRSIGMVSVSSAEGE